MKESEIRSVLAQLCRDLDSARAKVGVAVVSTTVALGTGCGGVVEESSGAGADDRADAAMDATADVSPKDAAKDAKAEAAIPEAGQDVVFDVGFSDALPVDAADDGPVPVYMSACLPPDPESDPSGA